MKRITTLFFLVMFAGLSLGLSAAPARGQTQTAAPAAAPKPSTGISDEFLRQWNRTGKKLIDMARDFPEDKFDYRAKSEQRTFAEQLLHAAGANYFFVAAAQGQAAPDSVESPSRDTYKTREQIVAFIQKVYADGAAVIKQQGDRGMLEAVKSPFGNEMYTRATIWLFVMNHLNDHYGQYVVYYRLNGLVPPESRRGQ